eukprot:TRINITY_DN1921_c0_g2_i6.p1 TRINITY_DN1921_c0_g2~~TRINITY_DN1921_c0_g2_i6.p1  ORF type:complete len:897 (+),score=257.89 TRINITY_DN1921_c0_g2_i6:375-3065(+)
MFKWLSGSSSKQRKSSSSSKGQGGQGNNELGLSPEDLAAIGLSPEDVGGAGAGGAGPVSDADLLEEFAQMEGVPVQHIAPRKAKAEQADVDVDKVLAETGDDVEVTFDENDMQDPELLSELSKYGWESPDDGGGGSSGRGASADSSDAPQPPTKPSSGTVGQSATTVDYSAQILALKRQALAAKKAGNKAEAIGYMKQYKELEARQSAAAAAPASQASSTVPTPTPTPIIDTDVYGNDDSDGINNDDDDDDGEVINSVDSSTNATVQSQIAVVERRIKEYQISALNYKKNNLLPEARQQLKIAKKLQLHLENLQLGIPIDMSQVPAPPPPRSGGGAASPRSSAGGGTAGTRGAQQRQAAKQARHQPSQSESASGSHPGCTAGGHVDDDENDLASSQSISRADDHVYDMLISTMEDQIRSTSTKAEQAYKTGDKPSALKLEAEKKGMMQDLRALRRSHASGLPPPQYQFEDKVVVETKTFPAINESALDIAVIKGMNYPGVGVETYVSVEMDYPKENPQKRESGRAKASQDPSYNFGTTLHIDRRSRALQKFFERRKITFCVWMPRFLRSPSLVGKTEIKLNPLMKQCEIDVVSELVDERRRKTGGLLEVRLRLRHPIQEEEKVTIKEKTLIIGAYNTPTPPVSSNPDPVSNTTTTTTTTPSSADGAGEDSSTAATDATPTAAAAAASADTGSVPLSTEAGARDESAAVSSDPAPTEPVVESTDADATTGATNAPPAPTTTTTTTATTTSTAAAAADTAQAAEAVSDLNAGVSAEDEELAMYLDDPLNVDLIVSNNVLEQESEALALKLGQMAAKGRIPDDLQDRKTAIDLKMQLLVIEVQTGKLTMPGYLERVKKAMLVDKKLAIQLNKMGKKQLAYQVLQRVKTMKAEVEEAEAG